MAAFPEPLDPTAAVHRKPLGDAAVLRRPRWCPVAARALRGRRSRRCSPGRRGAVCVVGGGALRVVVALAYAVVELRFHAALGWHRDVLLLNTLFASALPEPCRATGRALALCHAYGGSGLRRLRTGGAFDGDALRDVLRGARNGVVPKLTAYAAKIPLWLLAAVDAGARIGLELIGVACCSPTSTTPEYASRSAPARSRSILESPY